MSISFIMPEIPNFMAVKKGSINLCCYFVVDVGLFLGRGVWASQSCVHSLATPGRHFWGPWSPGSMCSGFSFCRGEPQVGMFLWTGLIVCQSAPQMLSCSWSTSFGSACLCIVSQTHWFKYPRWEKPRMATSFQGKHPAIGAKTCEGFSYPHPFWYLKSDIYAYSYVHAWLVHSPTASTQSRHICIHINKTKLGPNMAK